MYVGCQFTEALRIVGVFGSCSHEYIDKTYFSTTTLLKLGFQTLAEVMLG